jgi:hypothetical protein
MAELNAEKRYNKSLQVTREYERLWTDYDLHMLIFRLLSSGYGIKTGGSTGYIFVDKSATKFGL